MWSPVALALLLVSSPSQAYCPECKQVSGAVEGSGVYRLSNSSDGRCSGGCIYTKDGKEEESSYCFTPGSHIYTVSTCDEAITEETQKVIIHEDGSIFYQTITLRSDKMLVIDVPPHNAVAGVIVVMDRRRDNQVIKTGHKCLISPLPKYLDTEIIFKNFKKYSRQQLRPENITTILKEVKHIPSHLEFQSVFVQELCKDEAIVHAVEMNVTQEQFEHISNGEIVTIKEADTLPASVMGLCTSSKTVVTRVTPDHCFYIYSSDVTFHHLGTSTLVVDCCTIGTDPLPPGICWCSDITEANIIGCGGANILTINTCGTTFQSALTHVENFDGGWKQMGPTGIGPGETCQYNVQKLLPTGTCTFKIEFEVLDMTLNPAGWPSPTCTGSDWLSILRGPVPVDPFAVGLFQICGEAAGSAPAPVDISGCPQPWPVVSGITVINSPASVTIPSFSVNANLQIRVRADATTYQRKWAFKIKQGCY